MNLETPWYKYALEDPFEMSCFIYLDSNKKRKRSSQRPRCLKTPLAKVFLVKYLLPAPLEVQ